MYFSKDVVFNELRYPFNDMSLSSQSNNSYDVDCLTPATIHVIFPTAKASSHSSLDTTRHTVVPNISNSSSPSGAYSSTSHLKVLCLLHHLSLLILFPG